MSSARASKPAATDTPLEGMPDPAPRQVEPNAGELVAAWCRSWTATHGGEQPHGSVVRRVAGVCRNVAKDCRDLEEWRAAWRAARDAGLEGRYDVVAYLASPQRTGRGNHYLELVQNPGEAATGGLLGSMLAGGEPRALGGAS